MKKSIIQNKVHQVNAHIILLRKAVVNRLRWITTFVIMIFLLLYSRGLFSQTFSNPIQLTYIDSLELYLADTFIVDTSNMWFSFQSLSSHLLLVTSPIDTIITIKPDSVYIYTNINSNLQLVKSYDTVSIIDLDSMEIDQIYYIRTKYTQNGTSCFSIFGGPNFFTVRLTRDFDDENQLCAPYTNFTLSYTYPPPYPDLYYVNNCGELFICKNDLFIIEAYNQTDYNYAEWKWKLDGAYITETNNINISPPTNQDPPTSYTPGPNNNNYLPDPYKIVAYFEQGGSYKVSLTWEGWKLKSNGTISWYEGHKGIVEFTVTVLDEDNLTSNLPGDQCPNTDISSIMINIPPGFKVTKTYLERQPNIVVINNDTEFNSSFSLAEILTTTQTLPCGNYNLSVTFTPLAENIYFPQSCVPITPITKSFRIGFTPSISYTQNCFPNPIQFNGSSTCPDEITWWKWNFGDAQTSPLQNPTHQYNQPSNYNVYLSVGNNDPSCTFSTSTYYTFLTSPEKPVITGHNNNCSLECSYSVSNPNSNYIYTWTIVNSNPQNSNNYGSFSSSGVQTEIDGIGLSTVAIYWLSSFIAVPERVYLVVTVENAYGCIISDTMEIFDCCIGEDIVFQNETFPPIYINNKTVSLLHSNIISTLNQIYPGQIVINGILLVDQNLTINDNSHIKFGPCASIIINPACTLTINNSKLGQQCNYMWKGIYLNHGSSQIIITNNSEVCDALDGIVSRSGGNVYITSSVLKNNLYCLQIKNFGPPYVDDPVYFPGSVSMCSFTNDKAGGLLEYPPYAGFRSICGIETINVSNSGLIIGNAEDNSPNYFSNMNHAIRGTDSRLIICNNEFTDIEIPYFSSIDKDRQGAIYLLSTKAANIAPLNISASWVVLGGNDGNSNHFTNCNVGLYNYNQKATITNNTFVDCKNAIKLIEIISPTIIRENEINMTSVDEVGTGIFAANVNLKSTPDRIAISRNVITDMASGIRVINIRGHNRLPFVRIDTNLVFYSESSNPPPNPPIKTGIFAENCIYPRFRFDSISFADLEVSEEDIQRKKGIRLANVRTGTLIENHVYKAGSGIFTNGLLTNTQFLCNSLEDCFHGFYFGNYTSLSDQGYPENSQLNIPGLNPQNFFFGNYDPMSNCKLQSCDGCILNPEVRWFYQYGGSSSVLLDAEDNNSFAYEKIIPYPNINGTNACVLQNKDRRDTLLCDTITRESILGRILRNENFYEMLQEQYSYYDAYHLFELLGGDTSALDLGGSDDLDYRLLYDSLKNANPGAIENYYSSVDFNGLDSARYWNEHIYTNTDWDIYRKEVNNIYLNSWFINNWNLDSASRVSLYSIANEIPYFYGDAVYTARVMLDLHPDDLMLPYSSPYTANQQERSSILVYPNPTFGNITISVSGEVPESLEIRIYDIFGREEFNKRIENVQNENQIPLHNLSTGCYICKVYIAGSALAYTKVVIMGNK